MSLTFKPTSYLKPKNENELSELLRKFGERARIIAGGTGIYEIAHRGLISDVQVLLDIGDLKLAYVKEGTDSLKIGAATTLSSLARSGELSQRRQFAGIKDALAAIQPLQVKNVATIGGAICTALPFFDLPVSLLSLDATVRIGPGDSMRKLSEFLIGYFAIALEVGEFVREIEIPIASERAGAFQKFGLTHDDWALINCGVSLSVSENHRIVDPIVVFGGGVGEKPVRARAVESALSDAKAGDEEKIKGIFAENVPRDVETIADIRSSGEYRLQLAKVLGSRTVFQAVRRSREKSIGE